MNYQLLNKRFISAVFFTMMMITVLSLTVGVAQAQAVGAIEDTNTADDNEVAENSPGGATVGITARADNSTSYTLFDSVGGLFAIDEQSGIVTVAMKMPRGMDMTTDLLDHEAFSSHTIVVQASNADSKSTMAFTIEVTGVDEPLKFIADIDLSPNKIIYGSMRGDAVGIIARAVDPDQGSVVRYSLSGGSTRLFTIDPQNGVVTLALDSYDPESNYDIEITAESNDKTTRTQQFTIRADEPISIIPSPTTSVAEEGESQVITFSTTKTDYEVKGVSASEDYTCLLTADNRAVCWGKDDDGQSTPPSDELIAISSGDEHTCGLTPDNRAVCWGKDDDGQSTPPSDELIAISSGGEHTCAITPDNDAVCWGNTTDGQTTPTPGAYIAISAGGEHTCAITTDNDAVCWGDNTRGQSTPPAGRKYIDISAGNVHTCAITLDNDAVCWGRDALNSRPLSNIKYIAISAGQGAQTCAITTDNPGQTEPYRVTCRGGSVEDVYMFGAYAVSSGGNHSCAITTDNDVVCWASSETAPPMPPPLIIAIVTEPTTMTATLPDADRGQITFDDGRDYGRAVIPARGTRTTLIAEVVDDHYKEPETDYTINLSAAGRAEFERDNVILTVPVDDGDTVDIEDTDGASGGEVAENSPTGTTVGITVFAVNAATYTLTDDADGRFMISSTGLVAVADGSKLDFEDATSHSITVETDNNITMTFTIAVTDANDVITQVMDSDGADNELSEDAAEGLSAGITLSAIDEDVGDTVTYTLTDSDAGLFLADTNTGIVTLQGSLDYEQSTRHTIIAEAISDDGSSSTAALSIVVTNNINEITLEDADPTTNIVMVSANPSIFVEGLMLEATHADEAPITEWEITAQTSSPPINDLFSGFSEPQESATQTLLINPLINDNADLKSITEPVIVTLSIRVSTAFDETSEDFMIHIIREGIRLRVKVYLEGALE